MNFHDIEQLSAYLDGQLSPSEKAPLEARLAVDASLRLALDDLRVARGLLRRVPRRRAPRNFTLSPRNNRVLAPRPRSVLVLRYAGAIASLLFGFTIALNTLSPLAARSLAAAPVPGYGMGGGGGGADPTMEALLLQEQGTPALAAPAAPQDLTVPTAEPLAKTLPPAEASAAAPSQTPARPVPSLWILLLAVAGVVLGGLSWYTDHITRRNIHSKLLEK